SDALCRVHCDYGDGVLLSEPGLVHHFRVPTTADSPREICLSAPPSPHDRKLVVSALPTQGPASLILFGDPSPNPDVFATIASRLADEHADAAIFLGDAVSCGSDIDQWQHDFFDRAGDWFARVPHYWIAGNHDHDADILRTLLQHPGSQDLWQITIANTHLVGIDGSRNWAEPKRQQALVQALSSQAQRTLLFTHFPATSSTPHSRNDAEGRAVEAEVRIAREVILPLCRSHQVDAIISGHAHCYERIETPGDPIQISSGGAGGFLYRAKDPHPHSRVFQAQHHYCRLSLSHDQCTLTAVALDGTVLDVVAL
nr:metallophosphoesterase [Planctomycetota bacterium]